MQLPDSVAPALLHPAITAHHPAVREAYHPGRGTPCPDCGHSQWLVGRVVAECAHCDTVLPLAAGRHGFAMMAR